MKRILPWIVLSVTALGATAVVQASEGPGHEREPTGYRQNLQPQANKHRMQRIEQHHERREHEVSHHARRAQPNATNEDSRKQ